MSHDRANAGGAQRDSDEPSPARRIPSVDLYAHALHPAEIDRAGDRPGGATAVRSGALAQATPQAEIRQFVGGRDRRHARLRDALLPALGHRVRAESTDAAR